jgi:sialic acid synthase
MRASGAGEFDNPSWGRVIPLGGLYADGGGQLLVVRESESLDLAALLGTRVVTAFIVSGAAELVGPDGQVEIFGPDDGERTLEARAVVSLRPRDTQLVIAVKDWPSGASASESYLRREAPIVIAEIGCNHRGEFDIAVQMIKVASQFCGVDVVKFQKRTNTELLTEPEFNAPHPNPVNSYGDTYGAHREFLEFTQEQHAHLLEVCREWDVVYSSSVWDVTSAREIAALEPALIKVPSAINTDDRVMDVLLTEYGGEIHISLGMTSREEEEAVVERARRSGRLGDVVLYHCISGYPVDERDLCLLEIRRLVDSYAAETRGIGFSGHHRGISADAAALALGAKYFERHFTVDRTWKGTDHAASLEPDGLRRLTRDLSETSLGLSTKVQEITDIEVEQRRKLKRVHHVPS